MEAQSTNPPDQFDLMTWLMLNYKKLIAVVVGILIIGGVIGIISWNKEQGEIKANQEIFATPSIGLARPTASPDTYLKAAQENSGTQVGNRAELLAADVLFQSGKYGEAQAQFEKYLKGNAEGALQAEATLGVAASLDAQGKANEAIAKYLEVVNKFGSTSASSQAKLSLARLYEAQNKPEEAFKLYEQLDKSPNPYDPWRAIAMDKREQLLAEHPQLAPKLPTVAPQEQLIEVTTPPAGSTAAPTVRTITTNSVK